MKIGRKLKLTKELIKEFEDLIKTGQYANTVCDYLNISEESFYRWIREGNPDINENIDERSEEDHELKTEFYEAIKRAKAQAEIRNVSVIQKASIQNWTAAAWWLERTNWKKWGRKDKIEANISGEIKNKINIGDETIDHFADVLKILLDAGLVKQGDTGSPEEKPDPEME